MKKFDSDYLFIVFFLLFIFLISRIIVAFINSRKFTIVSNLNDFESSPDRYRYYLLGMSIYIPLTEVILHYFDIREKSELGGNIVFGLIGITYYVFSTKNDWLRKKSQHFVQIIFLAYAIYTITILSRYPDSILSTSEYTLLVMFSFIVFQKSSQQSFFNLSMLICLMILLNLSFINLNHFVIFANVISLSYGIQLGINYINRILLKSISISQQIVNHGPMIILAFDKDEKITFHSKNIERILNTSASGNLYDKKMDEYFHFDTQRLLKDIEKDKHRTLNILDYKGNIKHLLVEKIDIDLSETTFLAFTDITESNNMKIEIEKDQKRLKSLLKHTGDFIFVINEHQIITEIFSKDEYRKMELEYNLQGKPLSELPYHENTIHKIEDSIYDAIDSKHSNSVEINHNDQWYSIAICPIFTKNDLLTELILIFRDISTEKKNQLDAIRSEKYQQKLDSCILYLSTCNIHSFDSIESYYSHFVELVAKAINCTNISIWLYSDNSLQFITGIPSDSFTIKENAILFESDLPNYFYTIKNGLMLVADNAATHPDTVEFKENYLQKHNIKSILDVPVRINGKLKAIICFENTDFVKNWTQEETVFAKHLSEMLSRHISEFNQKEIEKKLIKTESNLYRYLQIANMGFWEYHPSQDTTILSNSAATILQESNYQLSRQPFLIDNFNTEMEFLEFKHQFDQLLQHHKPIDTTIKYKVADLSFKWIRIYAESTHNIHNEQVINGVFQDVNESVLNQFSLSQSEYYFKLINETIEDVFWLYDIHDQKVEYISPNCMQVFNKTQDEYYQKNDLWTTYVHPDDFDIIKNAHVLLHQQNYYEIEYRILVNNKVKWIYEKSFMLKNKHEEHMKNSGICIDITSKKSNLNKIARYH